MRFFFPEENSSNTEISLILEYGSKTALCHKEDTFSLEQEARGHRRSPEQI